MRDRRVKGSGGLRPRLAHKKYAPRLARALVQKEIATRVGGDFFWTWGKKQCLLKDAHFLAYCTLVGVIHFLPFFSETVPVTVACCLPPPQTAS